MLKRLLKIALWFSGSLVVAFVGVIIYVKQVSITEPPTHALAETGWPEVTMPDSGLFVAGSNWFRRSESGLYELYAEGSPYSRGLAIGALTSSLARHQEKVFNDQIRQMISSPVQLEFLRHFVGWFNRNLDDHVSEEYKLEIYGVSKSASRDYDDIAEPYQRILNYHAAHDIGHALQNMSLVGCTSFATWGESAEDGTLTIGRNFDFYVGDDFARDKIVAFYNPEQGHKFMMVTFGGMIGVLSGMNTEGLTVTINAAKSEIPYGAATPVSLVAREILQYASTIEEAYAIAEKREMFVAESFLIGSAKDGKAVIIEKSNGSIDLYDPQGTAILCTNHFQSAGLGADQLNRDHIATSASAYRMQRMKQLLERNGKNNVEKTVSILRDQKGLDDKNIGMGNEKAINQLVSHHGIVFQPEKKLVWVSTAPWQLGKFVCYDLNKVFATRVTSNTEIYERDREIPADPFLLTDDYKNFLKVSKYRLPFASKDDLDPDSVVRWNPDSYHSHMLAGDYFLEHKDYARAEAAYQQALSKEVATGSERKHILDNLAKSKQP